ncbi:MOSC domain-containing protein [Senegalia massiliensis]|uniref:MOSC domain-containing protein n=1 Tax=Senegalia massiliensis TaxID=1720316 RepID=UPI00102FBAD1|nr:hypothetical protein [Senegalia massiliensis]
MSIIELKYKDEFGKVNKTNKLYLIENKGIVDDLNYNIGKRQVSILFINSKKEIRKKDYRGLCIKKFYENILLEGIDGKLLNENQKFEIGNAIIQLKKVGKRCFDECVLIKEKEECILKYNVAFATVIKTGEIKVGDIVKKLFI